MPRKRKKSAKKVLKPKGDPWADKLGRPKGTTKVHGLPVELREELHRRLAARYSLDRVLAWLHSMGHPEIKIDMLKYYRQVYVTPADVLGDKYLARWLEDMAIRIDPVAAYEVLVSQQLQRLSMALDEEKDANVVMSTTGDELSRSDLILGHYMNMLRDVGLMPTVVSRVSAEIHQETEATVSMGLSGGVDVNLGMPAEAQRTLEDFRNALRRGFQVLAQEEELRQIEEEGSEDLPRVKREGEQEDVQAQETEGETDNGAEQKGNKEKKGKEAPVDEEG